MKRRPRIAHIPIMKATRDRIALAMGASVETFVHRPSSAAATETAKHLAIMTAAIDWGSSIRIGERTDMPSKAIVAALAAMESIEQRHDARDAWELTKDEARTMRFAASEFDKALRMVPFNVYEAARIFVEQALAPAA